MASYTCPVDCNKPRMYPIKLPAEPDISGIGVTIAYTSTAAFALVLVVAYYIFTYQPSTQTPDGHCDDQFGDLSRTNPIDEYLLFWRLRNHCKDGEDDCKTTKKARVETALTHAMLTMSDFQLITGLTILISGFTQLRCGISAYHWQRMVQLSWFSCITHLCCLTFLRQHFMQNKTLYAWRLPGMIALVVMLIVALVPTAHYAGWDDNSSTYTPAPADFAVCYFNSHVGRSQSSQEIYASSQQRMILSAILLGGGMMNRIWHLFWTPTQFYLKIRRTCSQYTKRFLSILYAWSESDKLSLWPFLVVAFIYRPLLAIFLTFRVLTDMVTSKAFEVWWLIMSFSYGMQNLWMRTRLPEPGNEKWSFGQVVALLVLVAPFITSVEGYLQDSNRTTPNKVDKTEPQVLPTTTPQPVSPPPEDASSSFTVDPAPDHDFYGHSFAFPIVIYAVVLACGISTTMLLVALRWRDIKPSDLLIPYRYNTKGGWLQTNGPNFVPPVLATFAFLILCVLLALVAEIQPPESTARRRSFKFLYIGSCTVSVVTIAIGFGTSFIVWTACSCLYFVLSIIRAVLPGLRSRADTSSNTQHTVGVV